MSIDAIQDKLLRDGFVSVTELAHARTFVDEQGGGLRTALERLGLASEEIWAKAASAALGLSYLDWESFPPSPIALEEVSEDFLRAHMLFPIRRDAEQITVACVDPTERFPLDALSMALGLEVVPVVATQRDILAALASDEPLRDGADGEVNGPVDIADVERLRDLASEAPVVLRVNSILARAAQIGASDIHLDPGERSMMLRYRVDGVLIAEEPPPLDLAAAVLSRIKIMAGLDIAERRLPQDGRIRWRAQGRDFDLRVATAPSLRGESVVMRLLERGGAPPTFAALGLSEDVLARLNTVLSARSGLFLVTGPTGSGKTTSLYAAMHGLNTPDRKIITVEDPVEYQLDGITQIQTKAEIGLDFSTALRSIVRQDPDVIIVGEIRDAETSSIAVQSALTGHLVLSTLHTRDAVSAFARLLDMGVPDYLLTSTVNAAMAQRLIRKLCQECAVSSDPSPELREIFRSVLGRTPAGQFKTAIGCKACQHRGYAGRVGVYEIVVMDDSLRRTILSSGDASALREHVRSTGTLGVFADALRAVEAGVTSFDEAHRAVHDLI